MYVAIPALGVILALLLFSDSEEGIKGEVLVGIASLCGLIFIPVGELVLNWIRAPRRIAESEADFYKTRYIELAERAKSKVALLFDPVSDHYLRTRNSTCVVVGVKNRSTNDSVHGLMLYIEGLSRRDDTGDYTDVSEELRNFSGHSRISSEPFSIGPDFEKFVYVACEKDLNQEFSIYFYTGDTLPLGEYFVDLIVTGLDVPPERLSILISKPTIDSLLTARVRA